MLQVRVHDGDDGRSAREHALDAGARKTSPAYAMHATNAAVRPAERPRCLRRQVRRIIVDQDHFPLDAGKGVMQPPHDFGDVVSLAIRRDHDDQLQRSFGCHLRRHEVEAGFGTRIVTDFERNATV